MTTALTFMFLNHLTISDGSICTCHGENEIQSRCAHDPVCRTISRTGSSGDPLGNGPEKRALPRGEYGFFELYCDESHCDCRRVVIMVLRPQTGWKPWAVINYGWESQEFYRKWAKAPASDRSEWQGPELDPLNKQGPYAPALLDLFKWVLESPGYVERLKKHYQLFREAVDKEYARGKLR